MRINQPVVVIIKLPLMITKHHQKVICNSDYMKTIISLQIIIPSPHKSFPESILCCAG